MEKDMNAIDKACDAVHSIIPGLPTTFSLEVEDIIDRSKTDIPCHLGQFAITCVLIAPPPLMVSFNEMFERGWRPNAGRPDAYYRYIDDVCLGISLEGNLWMIEATCPGRPAAVLALGSALVVTRNPMAATQLAELCNPEPPRHSSLQWGPYWAHAPTSDSVSAKRTGSFRRR
jgi:hypothetical protein